MLDSHLRSVTGGGGMSTSYLRSSTADGKGNISPSVTSSLGFGQKFL